MKVIEPSFKMLKEINGVEILKRIEFAGRICYKSDDKITDDSAFSFIKNIIASGHESVVEHESVSALIICDRGITHEIVRHRIASYSQESTRYCNYSKDKFGNELTFIKPFFWKDSDERYKLWERCMAQVEADYFELLKLGATPQEARSILPNSLKAELVVTMNLRQWRHFFKLRITPGAHPQMREIAIPMLKHFKEIIPVVFDDIET